LLPTVNVANIAKRLAQVNPVQVMVSGNMPSTWAVQTMRVTTGWQCVLTALAFDMAKIK